MSIPSPSTSVRCTGLIVVCWLAASGLAGAVEHDSPLTLRGFGTLGVARSDQERAEYVRDLSQPSGLTRRWTAKVDSVLGIQANLRFSPEREGVVQLISRSRYDGSFRPEVSWAFLRQEITPDVELRLGRLGTEFYLHADSRWVGYAHTTVRPPPDFYGPLVFYHFDGIDASASAGLDGGSVLRGKLYYGRSPETTPFYPPITWRVAGSKIMGGHLDLQRGPWHWRLAHARIEFGPHEIPLNALADAILAQRSLSALTPIDLIGLAPELSTVGKTSRFDSLGFVYDEGPLRIQGMLGNIRHQSAAYAHSRAAFVVASYRLGSLTPYLGFSRAKSTERKLNSPLLPPIEALAQAVLEIPQVDQRTLTIGGRWDFQEHWALKLQYDRLVGAPTSRFLFRGADVQWSGRMQVVSLALDFAF